jgi:ankyrin repeat protein
MRRLLVSGADPAHLDIYQAFALTRTPNIVVRSFLLGLGFGINGQDKDGTTPLIWWACRGDTDAVHSLLELGADAMLKTSNCEGLQGTALEVARKAGQIDTGN